MGAYLSELYSLHLSSRSLSLPGCDGGYPTEWVAGMLK